MSSKNHEIIVVGGGIFGLSTAIELNRRGHDVGLINPDRIPHPLAASTDISKIVRMEYGSDQQYFKMAEHSMRQWRKWNEVLQEEIYREVGILLLCRKSLSEPAQRYEYDSYHILKENGYNPQPQDTEELAKRFPKINTDYFSEAVYNDRAGYVLAGRAIERLAAYAHDQGVSIYEGQTASDFVQSNSQIKGVNTKEGHTFGCDRLVIAAGAHSPLLVDELKPYIQATGHPVFWLKPSDPHQFEAPEFPVFTADISNSGWYGFPLHPAAGVIKFGRHTDGLPLHPDHDERRVTDYEVAEFRGFISEAFPALNDAPLVYTRRCLYTDTLDGHFWIDHHPDIDGLTVCTGGSGHGMKMGPVVGEITADVMEGKDNPFAARFRWRNIDQPGKEDCRFIAGR